MVGYFHLPQSVDQQAVGWPPWNNRGQREIRDINLFGNMNINETVLLDSNNVGLKGKLEFSWYDNTMNKGNYWVD